MLVSGLCETPTFRDASSAMSASSSHTPCAASVRGPQNPIDSRYAVGDRPCAFREAFASSAVSARWIRTGTL